MNPFELLWRHELAVFHLGLGGCGGCGDTYEELLRDKRRGPVRLLECFSPRHAGLMLVTGAWTGGLTEPALRTIGQAPPGCALLLVGDCALGRDPAGMMEGRGARECPVEPDIEVPGCPVDMEALSKAVRDVAR